MNKLLRENIKNMQAYSSARDEFKGDASVYLDANENPYNFSITGTGISISTSVENPNKLLSLQVLPNPVSNQFRINGLTDQAEITILDMTGKVCQKALISSASVVLVDKLAKGMYVIHVSSDNKTAKLKLMKD
jgi:hypothetical protein